MMREGRQEEEVTKVEWQKDGKIRVGSHRFIAKSQISFSPRICTIFLQKAKLASSRLPLRTRDRNIGPEFEFPRHSRLDENEETTAFQQQTSFYFLTQVRHVCAPKLSGSSRAIDWIQILSLNSRAAVEEKREFPRTAKGAEQRASAVASVTSSEIQSLCWCNAWTMHGISRRFDGLF